ncbi:MAG: FAD-binding oxidoreductase [Rhodospirillales bacterium]|nr:FAD-binding oxidoreductase [Rhodospirillales bacterium]
MTEATTVNILPRDDNTNGWSRILPARTPKPSLKGDVRADWVVLGAGWAGMAAARRLAGNRPDDSIILVEAGEVGENASGRNSGFAIDLPHNVGSSLEELEGSHRFMALARAAIDHLEASVNTFGIDCNWSRQGKYHCSHSARGKREILEPFARELDALGEPCRWLDARELQGEVGTPYYHAAVYTPGCVLMNPAALCRGLGDTMPENVTLHENTPVTRLERENGIRLTTPEGSVHAPRMMLTTNGFAEQFGFFSDKLIPIAAHASLTRPLTASERRALGGNDDWGITPANAIAGVTMRFTQDHRILIRHGFHYTPSFRIADRQLRDAVEHHTRCFADRFPMLPDVTFDHSWSGFVCMSRNSAPGFGKVASNVWASVCQNAVGVTKGTIGGLLAADMACERENELIGFMQSLGEPDPLPHKALLKIGVPARIAWDIFTNRHEK